MGLTTQRRGPKFIFVQRSGAYTYMEAQKVFNGYLQRYVQWYGTYTLRDAQKSLRAVSTRIMLLLVIVWKKMYDQYKVKLKARVLQISIDQSKMSFQTSIC